MKFKKKFLKLVLVQKFLAFIGFLYIFFVSYTSSIRIKNSLIVDDLWLRNKPFIVAFWHSQLMMISFVWKTRKQLNILASSHSDGRFGSYLGNYFKLKNIPITSENKLVSLRKVIKILEEGNNIGITPDGPRGPAEKVSEGIIKIANLSQVPIIPVGFASTRYFNLRSWDSFLITLPFSRCIFVWGNPINVDKKMDEKKIRKYQSMIEENIKTCVEQANKDLHV